MALPLRSTVGATSAISTTAPLERPASELYAILRAYYLNNGVYDELRELGLELALKYPLLKGLRNPAQRVVEFYASRLWAGPLERAFAIQGASPAVVAAIRQVWTWSNWSIQKAVAIRWAAIYGDLWIKPVQTEARDRVYHQLIDPRYVTDFEENAQGFVQWARIDVPIERRIKGREDQIEEYTHTEVWDKAALTYRAWVHQKNAETEIAQLGAPQRTLSLLDDIGIDFIPLVRAPFRAVGEKRGVGAFTLSLDKIDEVNLMAMQLHRMLWRYNRPLWALQANANDPSGRPIPAPSLPGTQPGTASSTATAATSEVTLGEETLLRIPGLATLAPLVPPLDYSAALAVLAAQMDELREDLPELAYWTLRDVGDLSGRAVRLLLEDAISKAEEALEALNAALIRADEIALTLGTMAGLFKGLGSYEAGSFAHTFEAQDILTVTEEERAATVTAWTTAGLALKTALKRARLSDLEITEAVADKEAAQAAEQERQAGAILAARRNLDSGRADNGLTRD